MQRATRILVNLIFFIQVLLLFLLFFEERIELPRLAAGGRTNAPDGVACSYRYSDFVICVDDASETSFQTKQFRKIMVISLVLASLSAAVTALFGFFLSIGGDYGVDVLQQHKISGVVLSVLTFFLVVWYMNVRKSEIVFYSSAVFTIVVLVLAGHTGSILTHGENFVLAPVTKKEEVILTVENASLYQLAVMPVLEKKCFSCHNESKAKGKLIMTVT